MRIKICGLTQTDQAIAIANMGVSVLGFICVKTSPRYVSPSTIRTIVKALLNDDRPIVDRFGVFANAPLEIIQQTVETGQLTGVQLHGQESPQDCQQIRQTLPNMELIKALRLRNPEDLTQVQDYAPYVDTFLLDAYHPDQLGGTGHTLDWPTLRTFEPEKPWFLAGGLTPDNVTTALTLLTPNGIDLSSGVEHAPGDKNLVKVKQLVTAVSAVST